MFIVYAAHSIVLYLTGEAGFNILNPDLCFDQNVRGTLGYLFVHIRLSTLFIDWLYLYKKSHQDILQGISKLDNILKVSVIQKYKKGVQNLNRSDISLESVSSVSSSLIDQNIGASVKDSAYYAAL